MRHNKTSSPGSLLPEVIVVNAPLSSVNVNELVSPVDVTKTANLVDLDEPSLPVDLIRPALAQNVNKPVCIDLIEPASLLDTGKSIPSKKSTESVSTLDVIRPVQTLDANKSVTVLDTSRISSEFLQSQFPDVQPQNFKHNSVAIDVIEEMPESVELAVRKRNRSYGDDNEQNGFTSSFKKDTFLELEIQDGDTLQSLALKYNCTIPEIKAANRMFNDQDFFTLKTIKIPVHSFSHLIPVTPPEDDSKQTVLSLDEINKALEKANEHDQDKFSVKPKHEIRVGLTSLSDYDLDTDCDYEMDPYNSDIEVYDDRQPLMSAPRKNLCLGDPIDATGKDINEFLEHMQKDIEKVVAKVDSKKDNLDEVVDTLNVRLVHPAGKDEPLGTVAGLSWRWFIAFVVLIGVLGPVVYILCHKK